MNACVPSAPVRLCAAQLLSRPLHCAVPFFVGDHAGRRRVYPEMAQRRAVFERRQSPLEIRLKSKSAIFWAHRDPGSTSGHAPGADQVEPGALRTVSVVAEQTGKVVSAGGFFLMPWPAGIRLLEHSPDLVFCADPCCVLSMPRRLGEEIVARTMRDEKPRGYSRTVDAQATHDPLRIAPIQLLAAVSLSAAGRGIV